MYESRIQQTIVLRPCVYNGEKPSSASGKHLDKKNEHSFMHLLGMLKMLIFILALMFILANKLFPKVLLYLPKCCFSQIKRPSCASLGQNKT